jgi:hypothetical protein
MEAVGALILLAGAAAVYFLPSFAAKGKPNFGPVFIINLFLGWTLLGWVVALAMAASKPSTPAPQQGTWQPAAVPPNAAQYPAGWYPDPSPAHPDRYRMWSGQAWTDEVRDGSPVDRPPPAAPSIES